MKARLVLRLLRRGKVITHAATTPVRHQFQGRRLQQMEKKTNKFIEVLKAMRYVLLVAGIIGAYIGAVELYNYLAKYVW